MSEQDLPEGWEEVRISEILAVSPKGKTVDQGWSPQCERFPSVNNETWGVLKTTAIQDGYYLESENKQLPPSLKGDQELEVEAGDIILTCAGPRNRCGVVTYIQATRPRLMISGKMYRFRAAAGIASSNFLEKILRSPDLQKAIDGIKTGGSDSGLNLTQERFGMVTIPLPPLPEQKRIVAKLDTLLGKLGECQARLDRVPALLKRFRQSVLAAATGGRLTEDWREENSATINGAGLVEFIAKQRALGSLRSGTRTIGTDEIDEPGIELPESWAWARLGQVVDVKLGGTPSRSVTEYWNGTIPWVSSGEVNNGRIEATSESITVKGLSESNAKLYPRGTVLIAMIGEGRTRGQSAILEIEAATNQNVAALVLDVIAMNSSFVWFWALGEYERNRAVGRGGNQPALNGAKVRALPIPVPPREEQEEIVRTVESLFTLADRIEARYLATKARVDRLQPALLAKAFRGELVAQDPNDEPASVLLERVKMQRHSEGPRPRRGRKPA